MIQIPCEGDRIRLVEMSEDPDPMEPRATGMVVGEVCDVGNLQIDVNWDNGRTLMVLMLVSPPDRFEILGSPG